MVFGSSSIVLRSGMPSPAPGPVSDSTAPIVMSACAGAAASRNRTARADRIDRFLTAGRRASFYNERMQAAKAVGPVKATG